MLPTVRVRAQSRACPASAAETPGQPLRSTASPTTLKGLEEAGLWSEQSEVPTDDCGRGRVRTLPRASTGLAWGWPCSSAPLAPVLTSMPAGKAVRRPGGPVLLGLTCCAHRHHKTALTIGNAPRSRTGHGTGTRRPCAAGGA